MQQTWCWNVTVFWAVTPCSLVKIYRPHGWKRCSQFRRKFLQFAWRLLYYVALGLPTASSGPPGRAERKGKCEETKTTRSTHEGCWPLMQSTKQINTKLQPILTRKINPNAMYSEPRQPFRTSMPSSFLSKLVGGGELHCVLLWVGSTGRQAATQHSSIVCVYYVLSWDFLLTFGLYHQHIHGT